MFLDRDRLIQMEPITSGGGTGMDLEGIAYGADSFAAYVEEMTGVIGHLSRHLTCAFA
jgi:hypothetical protein